MQTRTYTITHTHTYTLWGVIGVAAHSAFTTYLIRVNYAWATLARNTTP